ncbi:MAG: hypothetical protein PHT69_14190 [Bacteroidales bacterium]|nr:hypothetical protein [Bacteroidales bacterium]
MLKIIYTWEKVFFKVLLFVLGFGFILISGCRSKKNVVKDDKVKEPIFYKEDAASTNEFDKKETIKIPVKISEPISNPVAEYGPPPHYYYKEFKGK